MNTDTPTETQPLLGEDGPVSPDNTVAQRRLGRPLKIGIPSTCPCPRPGAVYTPRSPKLNDLEAQRMATRQYWIDLMQTSGDRGTRDYLGMADPRLKSCALRAVPPCHRCDEREEGWSSSSSWFTDMASSADLEAQRYERRGEGLSADRKGDAAPLQRVNHRGEQGSVHWEAGPYMTRQRSYCGTIDWVEDLETAEELRGGWVDRLVACFCSEWVGFAFATLVWFCVILMLVEWVTLSLDPEEDASERLYFDIGI